MAMQLSDRPAFALRRTMPAAWARVGALPFDIAPSDFRRCAEHACIGDFAPVGRAVCVINGQFISRRDWWQPVRPGDVIVFAQVPQGEGSDPLRVILQIVVLAVATYFGGPLGAAIAIGGNLAINALLPLPQLPTIEGQAPSPTYSVAFQGNQARLGQSIPERFGQERVFPDFAAQPYQYFDGGLTNNQFYSAVLCIGFGEYQVLQVALDDSDVRNFEDVEFAIVGPGQTSRAGAFDTFETLADQSIAQTNIVTAPEVSGQNLQSTDWIGAFAPVRAGLQMDVLLLDFVFPGLGSIDDDGSVDPLTLSWQVGVRLIDDAGAALEPWRVLASESLTRAKTSAVRVSYAYAATFSGTGAADFPDHFRRTATLPVGRYEVRIRRVSEFVESSRVLNDMVWSGLRARLSVPGVSRDDCTYLVIRARASEQLSGLSQRRFSVITRRLIERYDADTETWDSAPLTVADNFTRNPAEIARYIMHRRGLADSRIDHATLDDLRDLCDERQDRFDFSFDSRMSFNDALQLVGRAMRSRPLLRRGAVYTMVRDELQTLPVAMYVPRNMDQDSFAIDVALATEDTPDAVLFRYRDGQVSAERVVWAQVHNGTVYAYTADASGVPARPVGVPAPSLVQEERLDGIQGRHHALREAAYFVAAAYFRRMAPSWSTNLEALLPTLGSLVGIAHDVAPWGQSGDVVNWDADTLTLTTSEPLTWTAGGTHYVRLQTTAGGVGPAILVTPGGADNEMLLDEAPAEDPIFDRADRERTRYLFGELAEVSRFARVVAIRPQSQTTIRMDAVIDDERVHTADAAWLPTGPGEQDPLPDGTYTEDDEDDLSGLLPVSLTDTTFELMFAEPAVVSFGTDGRVTRVAPLTPSGDQVADNWLTVAPVGAALAAGYEVRATLENPSEFPPAELIGTFDTWLTLNTARSFGCYGPDYDPELNGGLGGIPTAQIRVEVRDVATATVRDSALYRFYCVRP
jgi:hypothetical protein